MPTVARFQSFLEHSQHSVCLSFFSSITVCKVDVGNFRRLFLFLWLDCVCFVVFEKNPEKISEGFLTGHHTDTKILGAGLCVFCGWIVTVIVVFEKYSSKIPYINFANGDNSK